MTESKHTPAPWLFNDDDGIAVIAYLHAAETDGVHQYDLPNAKANARLIAAAPDLLAALEAIKARVSGEFDHLALLRFGALGKCDGDCGEIARAAIAKAKGESL